MDNKLILLKFLEKREQKAIVALIDAAPDDLRGRQFVVHEMRSLIKEYKRDTKQ